MMWSEKYRPSQLCECVLDHLDDDDQDLLRRAVMAPSLPNLLLHGPSGTGKTSIARILCDAERFEVNWFNGSRFEKHDVPQLEEMILSSSLFHHQRCILFDEIDGATSSSQKALRALMDENRLPVSWVCTGNDLSTIIPALQSRVIMVNCSYGSRTKRQAHFAGVARRCREIVLAEGIRDVTDAHLRKVVELHYPDIRQTINALQRKYAS